MRLLIAEDAPDVADVVAFGARMVWPECQVIIALDGDHALREFDHATDLVVLDVQMPPPDGFEVCRRIREFSPVPILMLTVRDATADKVRAFELGADDYLTKPFDHLELIARLRALIRRSARAAAPSTPAAVAYGDLSIDFASREVRLRGTPVSLTSAEYRLLSELVRQAGTVLSHRYLLEHAWGPEYVTGVPYLKVFVRRLRQKLGDDAEHPRYIQTEWGIGYRFVPQRSADRHPAH